MSVISTPLSIRPFLGTNIDFSNFRLDYLDDARRSSALDNPTYGLMGYVSAEAEWIALPGIHHAHIPCPDPGEQPVLPDAPTAAQINFHSATFTSWKF